MTEMTEKKKENKKKPEIKESTEYENCLDISITPPEKNTLDAFGEIEEKEDVANNWEKHWIDMPEFDQEDKKIKSVIVKFRNDDDYEEFKQLIGQPKLTQKTKSIWHPKLDKDANSLKRWFVSEEE